MPTTPTPTTTNAAPRDGVLSIACGRHVAVAQRRRRRDDQQYADAHALAAVNRSQSASSIDRKIISPSEPPSSGSTTRSG